MPSHPPLIEALLNPAVHPDRPEKIELRETHISWVLLAERWAYKLKKPVDLGFVDFTTLQRRRHFCEEEIRLNRRTAPELYEGVIAIGGTPEQPELESSSGAIEYAVRMRRFDDGRLLAHSLGDEATIRERMDQLARLVADFHRRAKPAEATSEYGTTATVRSSVIGNFDALIPSIQAASRRDVLNELKAWSAEELERLEPLLEHRRRQGRVRECHGDLHLQNIVDIGGRLVPFDAIEFNPLLRWTDVAAETAFLQMDLDDRGRSDLARRFLNAYLEACGDYPLLGLMPLMLSYRALVRAKIAVLRAEQAPDSAEPLQRNAERHIDLARRYTRPRHPQLAITYGLSGSGKTTGTQVLVDRGGWIRVRSDVERKRLAGLAPEAPAEHSPRQGLYTPEMTRRTYARLAEVAEAGLSAGSSVVVDATFLTASPRTAFRQLAASLGVPFAIVPFTADAEELVRRLRRRQQAGDDASDADEAVLNIQQQQIEPLSEKERQVTKGIELLLT